MRFDVIIGNPPYQEHNNSGQNDNSGKPIYQNFIRALRYYNYCRLAFIIPSRWACSGNQDLDRFRYDMLTSCMIDTIVTFERAVDVFPEADISGGVQIIVLDRAKKSSDITIRNIGFDNGIMRVISEEVRDPLKYKYIDNKKSTQYMLPLNNKSEHILSKIFSSDNLSSSGMTADTFNASSIRDEDIVDTHGADGIRMLTRGGNFVTVSRDAVNVDADMLKKYKVVCLCLSDYGRVGTSEQHRVIYALQKLKANEICTRTYFVLNAFDTEAEADNFYSFMAGKLGRFLVSTTLNSIHIISRNLMFIPNIDFSTYHSDEELYDKYGVTSDEREYINSIISDYNK